MGKHKLCLTIRSDSLTADSENDVSWKDQSFATILSLFTERFVLPYAFFAYILTSVFTSNAQSARLMKRILFWSIYEEIELRRGIKCSYYPCQLFP